MFKWIIEKQDGMEWIHLVQDSGEARFHVNTVVFRIP
jgi:hypothetical protein